MLFLITLMLAGSLACLGSPVLDLPQPTGIVQFGNSVLFSGTIRNDTQEVQYLNGVAAELAYGLLLDPTVFFDQAPFFLNAGESWSGPMFVATLEPFVPYGIYAGTFSVLGGPEPTSLGPLGTVRFELHYTDSTAVPEPSHLVLLGLCLIGATRVGAIRPGRRGRPEGDCLTLLLRK